MMDCCTTFSAKASKFKDPNQHIKQARDRISRFRACFSFAGNFDCLMDKLY